MKGIRVRYLLKIMSDISNEVKMKHRERPADRAPDVTMSNRNRRYGKETERGQ